MNKILEEMIAQVEIFIGQEMSAIKVKGFVFLQVLLPYMSLSSQSDSTGTNAVVVSLIEMHEMLTCGKRAL